MNSDTAHKLVQLNRQFYQSCASSFSLTRHHVQPGVHRVISEIIDQDPGESRELLDIGCGNGDLIAALAEGKFHGSYVGIDFSAPLMAQNDFETFNIRFPYQFQEIDLTDPHAMDILPEFHFDVGVCFAVMHHLPGEEMRTNFIRQVHRLIKPGGFFVVSVWQFLRSPRLSNRVLPWEKFGFQRSDMDENDYLLDWRAQPGETGIRYVHHFTEEELTQLVGSSGFTLRDKFDSDGKEGNLSIYQVWQKSV